MLSKCYARLRNFLRSDVKLSERLPCLGIMEDLIQGLPEAPRIITALYRIGEFKGGAKLGPHSAERVHIVGFSVWIFKVLYRGCERTVEPVIMRYQRAWNLGPIREGGGKEGGNLCPIGRAGQ